jgi:uncharacterized lipoprotein YbaY
MAQYGFTPQSIGTGYATPWGNYYVSNVVQVPIVATTSVSYPPVNAWGGWQLGAVIQNQVGGVMIVQVSPGGTAARAGLKAGDVVITAGGSQVGFVNGRVVDLIYEINQRVDMNGMVRLVVLDSITRQLTNRDLSIMPQIAASPVVAGQIFIDGAYGVSGNGTVKVELINVSRPYQSVAGGNAYVRTYGSGPFPFQIVCDPRYIYPTDRYRLAATLYDASQRVVSYTTLDIAPPVNGMTVAYELRLPTNQTSVPVIVSSYGNYYANTDAVQSVFRRYLNRGPTATESQVWQQQLASGQLTLDEMKAEVISSPAFYDRSGNNPERFIQQMIETTTQLPAPPDQLQYWTNRLFTLGNDRLLLAREYIPGRG